MAFPATHLKFAAHKKEDLDVENEEEYYSGTIYPDSRYSTGIAREKTHFDDLLPIEKHEDDFKLGWSVHYLCDQEQDKIIHDVFGDLEREEENIKWWVQFSAIKLAQDYFDTKDFEISNYLQHLSCTQVHFNKEDESELEKFLKETQESYQNFKMPEMYTNLLNNLKIEDELKKDVVEMGEEMVSSKKVRIQEIKRRLHPLN